MTKEEAKANQERIAKDFDLSYWYGTNCKKCCGVFPKFCTEGNISREDCFYQCEVCGRRTNGYMMPWQSEKAWNDDDVRETQIRWI